MSHDIHQKRRAKAKRSRPHSDKKRPPRLLDVQWHSAKCIVAPRWNQRQMRRQLLQLALTCHEEEASAPSLSQPYVFTRDAPRSPELGAEVAKERTDSNEAPAKKKEVLVRLRLPSEKDEGRFSARNGIYTCDAATHARSSWGGSGKGRLSTPAEASARPAPPLSLDDGQLLALPSHRIYIRRQLLPVTFTDSRDTSQSDTNATKKAMVKLAPLLWCAGDLVPLSFCSANQSVFKPIHSLGDLNSR